MAKFLYLLVCLAVFVNTGYALKCYMCNGEKIDSCIKSNKPKEQQCGNPNAGNDPVCLYKMSYDVNRKIHFANSSCEQVPQGTAANKPNLKECVPAAGVEIKECRLCTTDLCNSASMFSTNMITFLCLPVMFFFARFVLH